MAYFFQNRLLRYALSRLDIFEQDDLQRLESSWGRRSTVELRDVGIRKDKLASLLALPNNIKLHTAKIALLRVTVPADIYASPILIDINGVESRATLREEEPPLSGKDQRKADKATRGTVPSQPKRQNAQREPIPERDLLDSDEDDEHILPTTHELAKSFLAEEPLEERKQMEAAINTQPTDLQQSISSNSTSDDDLSTGMGVGLSLPGFIAGFLRDVVDRLQVTIRKIVVNLDVEIELPLYDNPRALKEPTTTFITLALNIEEVDVDSTSAGSSDTCTEYPDHGADLDDIEFRSCKRKVRLRDVRGSFLSDASVFDRISRGLGPETPTKLQSPVNSWPRSHESTGTSTPSRIISPTKRKAAENIPSDTALPRGAAPLDRSFVSSDGGRFADADEDSVRDSLLLGKGGASFVRDAMIAERRSALQQSLAISSTPDLEDSLQYGSPFDDADSETASESPLAQSRDMYHTLRSFRQEKSPSRSNLPSSRRPEGSSLYIAADDSPNRTPSPPFQSFHYDLDGLMQSNLALDSSVKSDNAEFVLQESIHQDHTTSSANSLSPAEADLTESTLFSHEDASSIYMSVMNEAETGSTSQRSFRMPGGWDDASEISSQTRPRANNDESHQPSIRGGDTAVTGDLVERQSIAPSDLLEKQEDRLKHTNMLMKECLAVDCVDIWIPDFHRSSQLTQSSPPSNVDNSKHGGYSKAGAFSHQAVPGAFSIYAESTSAGDRNDSRQSDKMLALHSPNASSSTPQYPQMLLEILADRIHLGADVGVMLMLAQLSKKLQSTFGQPDESSATHKSENNTTKSIADVMLKVKNVHLSFLESLKSQSPQERLGNQENIESVLSTLSQEALFAIKADDIQLSLKNLSDLHNSSFLLGSLSFGCLDDDIISFKRESKMRMSLRDPEDLQKHAISIKYGRKGAVSDVNISTIPMRVIMDLQKIDDTLGSFGGVSGLLEIGGSILSESTVSTTSPVIKPRQRSVRFEQQSTPVHVKTQSGTSKINLRMGGSHIALKGKHCTISMHTTAIKVVSRDTLIGFHIDDVRLDGPHLVDDKDGPEFRIKVQNLGLKYLFSPDEGDLTRLISLLTPSKDKFEAEDDLLLDTLIRQRRKGAVLRVNIALADVEIDDLAVIQTLRDLSQEMSRLSSFAKYLPAETRPGLMTLAMVDAVNLRVDTGVTMGLISVAARSLDVAHISAPSLIALGIDTISAHYKDQQTLVSPVLPHTDSSRPLMLMARMIGDELEPTLKVKLWNTCFDYSVPLIMGFMDLNRDQTTEEFTVDMATSVMTFADSPATRKFNAQSSPDSGKSGGDSKPLHLAFDLRDCAIGLNPRNLPSKGLFLVSDCRFTGALPKGSSLDVSLGLRKADLLIIDDTKNIQEPEDIGPPKRGVSFETRTQHLSALCHQGFVSVVSISAATIRVQITESPPGEENVVDIDIKDELFVLETCADSTQTLGEILGALLPPMPPSKGVKYRTEVAPIEDMMASFTGDAFATISETPSTVLEEDDVDYGDNELTADFDDLGNLPIEVDTSPTETDDQSEFENNSYISDAKATHPLQSRVDIGELEEAQSVILGGALNPQTMQSQIQGTAHRWDSANNRYIPVSKAELSKSPLRLRIRDMHIIWNLYDGYDWAKTRDTISKAVMDVETKAEERRAGRKGLVTEEEEQESVIGDFLFNSIYIGVSQAQDPRELTRNINRNIDDVISETGSGTSTVTSRPSTTQRAPRPHHRKLRLNRSRRHKITFELGGTSLDLFLFSQGGETQSSIDVRVKDFEIFDHVPTSTWKKFVTYMQDAGPREDSKAMIHLEICNVRPIPDLTATELVIRASVLPLRLHVDQDALDFMTRFFDFSDNTVKTPTPPAEQAYLQRVEVRPVPIKLDYKPKKVDYGGLRSGRTKEFMNFFILDGADMVLRHAIIYGCSGFDRLHRSLEDVWMPDITRNQLPTVLAGLNGVRTLVNVGQGVRDLVVIPVQEYRRNGRVVRSISKGALAFAKTTGSEITRFGAKLAVGAQNALQGAEGLLAPHQRSGSGAGGGYHDWDADDNDGDAAGDEERRTISRYAHQPANILAGLKGAARSLERDLLVTKDAIVAVAGEVRESGSAEGAARAMVRGAPTVVLRPMIGASRAAGMALMGAANSVDPENLRRASDKYKRY